MVRAHPRVGLTPVRLVAIAVCKSRCAGDRTRSCRARWHGVRSAHALSSARSAVRHRSEGVGLAPIARNAVTVTVARCTHRHATVTRRAHRRGVGQRAGHSTRSAVVHAHPGVGLTPVHRIAVTIAETRLACPRARSCRTRRNRVGPGCAGGSARTAVQGVVRKVGLAAVAHGHVAVCERRVARHHRAGAVHAHRRGVRDHALLPARAAVRGVALGVDARTRATALCARARP